MQAPHRAPPVEVKPREDEWSRVAADLRAAPSRPWAPLLWPARTVTGEPAAPSLGPCHNVLVQFAAQ
ncbi:hypothetical protein SKAU_G00375080 [Synaphobranchus kaupii]|uniref:Uncharacterized protein n=1 Tax=Synaphobranchus kaupii TaxID=118154 RepID=A0A9Q1EGZ2_SYNKA|nr:hypothetical protein SKAU_G00375080 [Synaphobranchus kaupii]